MRSTHMSPTASDPPIGQGLPLIRAAEGFAGDGVWTAANRSLERKSRVYGQDGELLFDYEPRSLRITFR